MVYIAQHSKVRLHISHLRSYNSKELGCDAKSLMGYIDKTADIVLFDLNKIKGFEDYFEPTKDPVGVRHVILKVRFQ